MKTAIQILILLVISFGLAYVFEGLQLNSFSSTLLLTLFIAVLIFLAKPFIAFLALTAFIILTAVGLAIKSLFQKPVSYS
jgi:hypothetical protein